MKANKDNYKKIKEKYIPHQYEVIDSILESLDKMDVNDQGSYAFSSILEAHIISLMFRLKGYLHFIKEVFGEEIKIPDKYTQYAKMAQDYIYLKGNELMVYNIKTPDAPKSVFELIEIAKKKKEDDNQKSK